MNVVYKVRDKNNKSRFWGIRVRGVDMGSWQGRVGLGVKGGG